MSCSWFSCGSGLIQVWFRFGSALVQRCVVCGYLVQPRFSVSSAACGLMLYGSALGQIWFSGFSWWCSCLWHGFLWFSCGSALLRLGVAGCYVVRRLFSVGLALCGQLFYGSGVVQHWYSFASACCGQLWFVCGLAGCGLMCYG